jgi:hypothetical protein
MKTVKQLQANSIEGVDRVYTEGGYMYAPIPIGAYVECWTFDDLNHKSQTVYRHRVVADLDHPRGYEHYNNRMSAHHSFWRITAAPDIHAVREELICHEDEVPEGAKLVYGHTWERPALAVYARDKYSLEIL